MVEAMRSKTKIKALDRIDQAIKYLHGMQIRFQPRVYKTLMEWLSNRKSTLSEWSLCSRQHCPYLLQHTSTNALESYHYNLKRRCRKNYGFGGAILKISETNKVSCFIKY